MRGFVLMQLVFCFWVAGLYFMGNTNAQDQELTSLGEFHGQDNSLMRKLSLLFLLVTLMDLNGSSYNYQYFIQYLFN